jgi:hypothetical protein
MSGCCPFENHTCSCRVGLHACQSLQNRAAHHALGPYDCIQHAFAAIFVILVLFSRVLTVIKLVKSDHYNFSIDALHEVAMDRFLVIDHITSRLVTSSFALSILLDTCSLRV